MMGVAGGGGTGAQEDWHAGLGSLGDPEGAGDCDEVAETDGAADFDGAAESGDVAEGGGVADAGGVEEVGPTWMGKPFRVVKVSPAVLSASPVTLKVWS